MFESFLNLCVSLPRNTEVIVSFTVLLKCERLSLYLAGLKEVQGMSTLKPLQRHSCRCTAVALQCRHYLHQGSSLQGQSIFYCTTALQEEGVRFFQYCTIQSLAANNIKKQSFSPSCNSGNCKNFSKGLIYKGAEHSLLQLTSQSLWVLRTSEENQAYSL